MSEPLTLSELVFLNRLMLSEDDVLQDCEYYSPKDRNQAATEQGKALVVGSKCKKAGHRLRTRSNHCVQCDPEQLRHQQNYSESGHVYIAGSLAGNLIKISFSRDCHQRVAEIRRQKYGGFGDWQLLEWFELDNAGEIESRAQSKLHQFNKRMTYYKNYEARETKDLFACSFSRASLTVREMLPKAVRMFNRHRVWTFDFDQYEFEGPDG